MAHELSAGVRLTGLERKIFDVLAGANGETRMQWQIIAAVYPYPARQPQEKLVDVKVCHIRRKLRGTPYRIENVWGNGYRLVADDLPAVLDRRSA